MIDNQWPYDLIANIYDDDIGKNMPFDDINAYLKLMNLKQGKIIEVGAGTGRLTIPFLKAGLEVLAIERSKEMLQVLQKKIQNFEKPYRLKTQLTAIENIKNLNPNKYDAIIMPYSIICYIIDEAQLKRVLKTFHQALKNNGILIIDAFIPKLKAVNSTTDYFKDYKRETSAGVTITRYKRIYYNVKPHCNLIERKYIIKNAHTSQSINTKSIIKPYSPKNLIKLLKKTHFKTDTILYDYQYKPKQDNTSFYTIVFKQI